jgi:putative transposase
MEFDSEFDEDAVEEHVCIHFIFSTAGQRGVLPADGMEGLHQRTTDVLADLGAAAEGIGGTTNHVHILASLPVDRTADEIVQKVKAESAAWVRANFPHLGDFRWQQSYGAFSLSPEEVETGVAFIRDQAEHHEIVTFQDEFRTLLREHNIPFDENDLWE